MEPNGEQLRGHLDLLEAVWDVVLERVEGPGALRWVDSRGWRGPLLALDDWQVSRAEQEGVAAIAASLPRSLAELVEAAEARTAALEGARPSSGQPDASPPPPGTKLRKHRQIQAVLPHLRALLPGRRRLVDVGSGHGHLAREAVAALQIEVVGVERDPSKTARSRELAGPVATFVTGDAERSLELSADDLVVGLHACGQLTDLLIERGRRAGAAVFSVPCCYQKGRDTARESLSELARRRGFRLAQPSLGLANLTVGFEGIEAPISASLTARETRHALRLLLRARGVDTRVGEESRGINRRQMRRGLAAVATPALEQRGLPPALAREVEHFQAEGRREYAIMRRLALPRVGLSRLLETSIVLDHATALEDRGYEVRVFALFDRSVSPRNLGIRAAAPGGPR